MDQNLNYDAIEDDFKHHMNRNKNRKWSMYTNYKFNTYDKKLFWQHIYRILLIDYDYEYLNFEKIEKEGIIGCKYGDGEALLMFKTYKNIFNNDNKKFYFETTDDSMILPDITSDIKDEYYAENFNSVDTYDDPLNIKLILIHDKTNH